MKQFLVESEDDVLIQLREIGGTVHFNQLVFEPQIKFFGRVSRELRRMGVNEYELVYRSSIDNIEVI